MADLMRYAAALADAVPARGLPPVEKWNPPHSGALDLVIRSDGTWVHEGAVIERARLVRLFSTVLKREGERYFLVTPVEKFEINVEDAPFVAVLMRAEDGPGGRRLIFTTNVGDEVTAGADHAIVFCEEPSGAGRAPYIHVRGGLEAKIARTVFYELVDLGETREAGGREMFGVASGGVFFPLGEAADIFGDR